MKKILVIGSTNVDHVASVKHIPVPGETIISSGFAYHFGGKGANQAYACGKLGSACTFLSSVGSDDQGMTSIKNLQSVGVNTKPVKVCDGTPTGLAWISVDDDGNNSIVVVPGANAKLDSASIDSARDIIEDSDIVLAQLETDLSGVWEALRIAGSMGKLIILDPAPAARLPEDVLQYITYLTPNESELALLTGLPVSTDKDVANAAQVLLRKGIRNVLVTLGGRGCLLINQNKCHKYKACEVSTIDTTAAGDTFNAAFAVWLSEVPEDVEGAIAFSSAAAALSTTRPGAQESVPTREEVLRWRKKTVI